MNTFIKSKIRVMVHQLLLPRGRQYVPLPELEYGWEKNFIENGDKKICVLWHKNRSYETNRIVILSHPYLADAKSFFLIRGHAEMYMNHRYQVMLFDYNGFGESPFVDFNYAEDLLMVADFVKKSVSEAVVFGHGISFGASHTINYSTKEQNVFHKIIVENCLDSNLSYYKKRNRKLHVVMLGLMKIFPQVNKDHNYIKSMSNLVGVNGVLLIYNNNDDLTTVSMGESLYHASNIPAKLVTFDGIHLRALQDNKKEYTEEVISFLQNI
jgi:hypothetical protein